MIIHYCTIVFAPSRAGGAAESALARNGMKFDLQLGSHHTHTDTHSSKSVCRGRDWRAKGVEREREIERAHANFFRRAGPFLFFSKSKSASDRHLVLPVAALPCVNF